VFAAAKIHTKASSSAEFVWDCEKDVEEQRTIGLIANSIRRMEHLLGDEDDDL
jgi:hypothetical protein